VGGHRGHVCSRAGGRGRHRAPRCHGVPVRARRHVRAVPDPPRPTLARRTAPPSHRCRLPAHVRRPYARSEWAREARPRSVRPAARAAEIQTLNGEKLDLEHRRAPVCSKGGAVEWVYGDSGTAHLLTRSLRLPGGTTRTRAATTVTCVRSAEGTGDGVRLPPTSPRRDGRPRHVRHHRPSTARTGFPAVAEPGLPAGLIEPVQSTDGPDG
jgi:hypothetical protein